MEINNLIETFAEFKEQKSIDRATMMRVIEEVFRNILAFFALHHTQHSKPVLHRHRTEIVFLKKHIQKNTSPA